MNIINHKKNKGIKYDYNSSKKSMIIIFIVRKGGRNLWNYGAYVKEGKNGHRRERKRKVERIEERE